MNLNLPLLISCLLVSVSQNFMMTKFLEIYDDNKIKKYVISCIITIVYLYFSYSITMFFVRYLMFILISSIITSRIYKINISKTIIASLISWVIFLISELLFAIIVIVLFKFDVHNLYGGIIGNFCISLISLSVLPFNKFEKLIKNTLKKVETINCFSLILLLLIIAASLSIIVYINYFNQNINSVTNFVLSLIVIFAQITITILLFFERNDKVKIQTEYECAVKNLKEYEGMLDYQRVTNHENKNDLLVIKGMVEKRDKNTIKYIDNIIKTEKEPNDTFLYQTNKIPSGGLRGLVYYKTLLMKEKNINVSLDISNSVRKIDFEKMDLDFNRDVCRIIGVFLDNAIEAVCNEKNKNISITMNYDKDKFTIIIMNNFTGVIDMDLIDNKGYTTKNSGHGYGLSLVKELVSKYDNISNKRIITRNIFKQEINIDM